MSKGETKAEVPVEDKGWYDKYIVRRADDTDGPGGKHEKCELFVIDLTHDLAGREMLLTYAAKIMEQKPKLAQDLVDRVIRNMQSPAELAALPDGLIFAGMEERER